MKTGLQGDLSLGKLKLKALPKRIQFKSISSFGKPRLESRLASLGGETKDENKFTRTFQLFRSGVKSHPGNAKVHYNYGNWLRDQGRHQMASLHYKEAIR